MHPATPYRIAYVAGQQVRQLRPRTAAVADRYFSRSLRNEPWSAAFDHPARIEVLAGQIALASAGGDDQVGARQRLRLVLQVRRSSSARPAV